MFVNNKIVISLPVNNPQNRRIGSVNDIDPANGVYGSIDPRIDQNNSQNVQNVYQQQQHQQQNQTRQSQQYGGHHHQQQQQPPQQPAHKSKLVRRILPNNIFV